AHLVLIRHESELLGRLTHDSDEIVLLRRERQILRSCGCAVTVVVLSSCRSGSHQQHERHIAHCSWQSSHMHFKKPPLSASLETEQRGRHVRRPVTVGRRLEKAFVSTMMSAG